MPDEGYLIRLRAAGDKSRQAGDPYAPGEITREIEEAAGVANLVLLERAISSLTTKATKAAAEIVTHHVVVCEPNQSSSCPLSSTN